MTNRTYTLGVITSTLAATLLAVSCSTGVVRSTKPEAEVPRSTYIGVPLSVNGQTSSTDTGFSYGSLSTVLAIDGQLALVSARVSNLRTLSDAVALIEAEIRDGDADQIQFSGVWNGRGEYIVKSVTLGTYEITF